MIRRLASPEDEITPRSNIERSTGMAVRLEWTGVVIDDAAPRRPEIAEACRRLASSLPAKIAGRGEHGGAELSAKNDFGH